MSYPVALEELRERIPFLMDHGLNVEVDLSDIVAMAQALGSGQADCLDFNNDGAINLSDITRFVPAIGAQCD